MKKEYDVLIVGAGAAGLYAALQFPEDVSVVGFDGIDLCRFSIPRLTTVEQPVDEIARRSVNLLLDMMEKGAAPRHITVKAVFRSRDHHHLNKCNSKSRDVFQEDLS